MQQINIKNLGNNNYYKTISPTLFDKFTMHLQSCIMMSSKKLSVTPRVDNTIYSW